MRVCDISKTREVEARVLIVVVPLSFGGKIAFVPADEGSDAVDADALHDLDVSAEALEAFRALDWSKLNDLTPRADRPKSTKSSNRSEGARKAAKTRAARRAEATAAAVEAARQQAEIDEARGVYEGGVVRDGAAQLDQS